MADGVTHIDLVLWGETAVDAHACLRGAVGQVFAFASVNYKPFTPKGVRGKAGVAPVHQLSSTRAFAYEEDMNLSAVLAGAQPWYLSFSDDAQMQQYTRANVRGKVRQLGDEDVTTTGRKRLVVDCMFSLSVTVWGEKSMSAAWTSRTAIIILNGTADADYKSLSVGDASIVQV